MAHDRGPLANWLYDELAFKHSFQEVHETFGWFVVIFIVLHLFALFYHEHEDGVPTVQSMFSGFQYKKKEKENEKIIIYKFTGKRLSIRN